MRIDIFLFVVGAVVAVAAFNDVLPNEDPSENMEFFTFELENAQDEMAEQALFRKGCSTGRACRKRKGTCMSNSESCNGTTMDKGCGYNCTCCIMASERCTAKRSCKDAKGLCMKGSRSCTGYTIPDGCTGKDCICCVNDNNCPNGFYRVGTECFKVYKQFAGWDKARQLCQEHGWQLAEPEDLPALAKFIYTNVSHYYFWIGGRGIGGSFKYLSGQSLQANASWTLGKTSVGDCLMLQSTNTSYTSTLASNDCNTKYYFICEPACPKGFIRFGSDCFKVVSNSQKWEDAERNCYAEGLQIAEPEDPKSLAKSLYEGIGGKRYTSHHLWIGARGGRINGSMFAWNSGEAVPIPYPNNDTWQTNYPRSYAYTSSYCLQLYTYYHSRGPMWEYGCSSSLYSLCEMICPLGFFRIGNQCYKAYTRSASSWADAHDICNQAHLTLAEPQDPTAVADYLLTVAGHRNFWLGGRGDGSRFRWSSGEAIPSDWTPWQPENPGNKVGKDYCLELAPEKRTTPLTSTTCSKQLYPICQ